MSKNFAEELFDKGLLSKKPIGEHWRPIQTKDRKVANYMPASSGGMWHLGGGWMYSEELNEFAQIKNEQELEKI